MLICTNAYGMLPQTRGCVIPLRTGQVATEGLSAYAAIAFNGRGITMASTTGRLLAELLMGRPEDECPIPLGPVKRIRTYPLRVPGIAIAVPINRAIDRLSRLL